MPRLIFVNRFFYPDHSATSQILSDLAFALAKTFEVHVVASDGSYDGSFSGAPVEEVIAEVCIHRIPQANRNRSNLAGRMLSYAGFYRGALRQLRSLVRPGDVVVAKTDPPLLSILLGRLCRQRGAQLVNWLQDVYPEVATALGVVPRPLAAPLVWARDRSLRDAAGNVVLSEGMARLVTEAGARPDTVRVIHNWCDSAIQSVPHQVNPLWATWELQGKFVVGYSGNLGRAHEFETILGAAEALRDRQDIVFLLIGGGHGHKQLTQEVAARGLSERFLFKPYQSRDLLSQSLSASDVHWVSLRPELEGLIVPSKVYGILAAGRPVIAIGASDGEIARIVAAHTCGARIAPGDSAGLAILLRQLADEPGRVHAMGVSARACLDKHFTFQHALANWQELIAGLLSSKKV